MSDIAEVDYVIVGAGSAGCVLANRLTEDPDTTVLLLEAGGWDWNPLIHIPIGVGKLVRSHLHSWGYSTEPEPHLDNRQVYWPRGRVVGGSSSVNSMIYIRGHASDYDQWAQLGNQGWGWSDVVPYFRRSEGHTARSSDELHSTDGPLHVQRASSDNPLYEAFQTASKQAGHPENDDFNGPVQDGVGRYDFTIHNGRRWSAASAYLKPAMDRPNLIVTTRALTNRVIMEGNRAVGVEYLQGAGRFTVRARREVLLSGGAINSPQILMLSGIGAPEVLKEHGIDTKVALPGVGENLQDHCDVPLRWTCTQPITLYDFIRIDKAAMAMLQAAMFRNGPATSFPAEGGLFSHSKPGLEAPDLQWHMLIGLGSQRMRWPFLSNFGRGRYDQDGFTVRVCHLRPESRGRITLRSDDPRARVRIFANYLATEEDRRALRDATRKVREVVAQAAFDPFRGEELDPGASATSDGDIDAWVRNVADTIYHPVGTAKMGSDPMAVVDTDLKVHGVDGLRVVDASVMPTLIGGNTNAPTMMIAERASDLIRGRTPLPQQDGVSAAA